MLQKGRKIGSKASVNEGEIGMGRINSILEHYIPTAGIIYLFAGE